MCKYQMSLVKNKAVRTQPFCEVAAAYLEQCHHNGVELPMPLDCVNCQVPLKPELRGGESTSYHENAPHSADVVFVVQQASCLNNFHMTTLIQKVEASLKQSSATNNNYAVVGFGGEGELHAPHVFTSASKVFNDHNSIQAALLGLSKTGTGLNVYEAMSYAANINNRPSVGKVMVVVTCEEVFDGSLYGDVLTMLSDNDIKMHYITPHQLALRRSIKSDIFGYDATTVFTSRTPASDPTLRRHLRVPKDYLSALATESGGSVFTQAQLAHAIAKPNNSQGKQAASVFGARIASSGLPSSCQVCDCVADRAGMGKVLCQQCFVPAFDLVLHNWNKYGGGSI